MPCERSLVFAEVRVTLCGYTIASSSASVMSKISLPSAVSPSRMRRFDTGASSSDPITLESSAITRTVWTISGMSMNSSSRTEDIFTTCGEQERQMQRFKSIAQTQRLLAVHSVVHNVFRVGRHYLKAIHHRLLRGRAFADRREATCVH